MGITRRTALRVLATGGAAAAFGTRPAHASTPADPESVVGMLYDTTRCIGCRACTVACRQANGLEAEGERWDQAVSLDVHTKSIIKLCRDGDGTESFMKTQCMHCVEPACVSVCMFGALQKREGGAVTWEGDACVGCRYCEVACPFNVPRFEYRSMNPRVVKCELCAHRLADGGIPACVEVCPRDAIIFGRRAELLAEAHRRIAERPSFYQPRVYGEHEAGGTQVLYISHIPFEELGLPSLGNESLPDRVHRVQGTIYKGFVAPLTLFGVLSAVIARNVRRAEAAEAAEAAAGGAADGAAER